MSEPAEPFSIGVEEEYLLVDAATGRLVPDSRRVLERAPDDVTNDIEPELYLSQIESGTPVCRDLGQVRAELVRLRRELAAEAEKAGNRLLASGTHPFSHWRDQEITPKTRYRTIVSDYQQLAREQIICGCHVHVGIPDPEVRVRAMGRCRPWLAPVLALAANSPFWLGRDSGYASFGREMWRRWPMAGMPPLFGSRAEYDALVDALVATGSIREATKIYWDMRLSERYETLEFRVTDVCMTVDEAVMVAGVLRALAETCAREGGEPGDEQRHRELLVAANWRASRHGLDAELVDLEERRVAPAPDVVRKLLAHVRPALERGEEWDTVSGLVDETFARGNGAMRQRAARDRSGDLAGVVAHIAEETSRS